MRRFFEDQNTLFNLLIRKTSKFLCYERLLNMTYVAYKKMHFSAKCNSGRIAIQWFHIKHYLDYQYTKFQSYTFQVQKMCVFARYATLVPRLHPITSLFRNLLITLCRKYTALNMKKKPILKCSILTKQVVVMD